MLRLVGYGNFRGNEEVCSCGFAAAQCGKPLAYRLTRIKFYPRLRSPEAKPQGST